MRARGFVVPLLAAAALLAAAVRGAERCQRYVDAATGDDNRDGSSWAAAKRSVNAAVASLSAEPSSSSCFVVLREAQTHLQLDTLNITAATVRFLTIAAERRNLDTAWFAPETATAATPMLSVMDPTRVVSIQNVTIRSWHEMIHISAGTVQLSNAKFVPKGLALGVNASSPSAHLKLHNTVLEPGAITLLEVHSGARATVDTSLFVARETAGGGSVYVHDRGTLHLVNVGFKGPALRAIYCLGADISASHVNISSMAAVGVELGAGCTFKASGGSFRDNAVHLRAHDAAVTMFYTELADATAGPHVLLDGAAAALALTGGTVTRKNGNTSDWLRCDTDHIAPRISRVKFSPDALRPRYSQRCAVTFNDGLVL